MFAGVMYARVHAGACTRMDLYLQSTSTAEY